MAASRTSELAERVRALCAETFGPADWRIEGVEAGLGTRRFLRAIREDAAAGPGSSDVPRSVIARCELPEDPALRPVGVPPEPPLEPIRALLERHGLPVPRCFAARDDVALLEDVGDRALDAVVRDAAPAERDDWYRRACDLVPRLQAIEAPADTVPNFGRRLDAGLIRYKAEQVVSWLVPWATGREATASDRRVVETAFAGITEAIEAAPRRLAHRDFKAQNLHVVAPERSASRLVMIDLQGAFLAPPEYDLVCLLRDLQVELSRDEIRTQRERVRAALPDAPSRDEFEHRFDLLTLSRVGKDLSRFRYAIAERGDDRYRRFLPTGVRHLRDAAAAAAAHGTAFARFADLVAGLPDAPTEPSEPTEPTEREPRAGGGSACAR